LARAAPLGAGNQVRAAAKLHTIDDPRRIREMEIQEACNVRSSRASAAGYPLKPPDAYQELAPKALP